MPRQPEADFYRHRHVYGRLPGDSAAELPFRDRQFGRGDPLIVGKRLRLSECRAWRGCGGQADYTRKVQDGIIDRPRILRCPANPPGGWIAEKNFSDYIYARDCSNVYGTLPSFNMPFNRLKREVLTFCVTGDFLLRNGVEGKYAGILPGHNGGITVVRANGSAHWVPVGLYRTASSLEWRLKRIDNMN